MNDILLLGDACFDKTITIDTSRSNPEKPGQSIWKVTGCTVSGGMLFNVRECLKALGLKVKDFAATKSFVNYTTKSRFIDNNGNFLARIDDDKVNTYNLYELIDVLEAKEYSAVVISDYNKGAINEKILRFIDAAVPDSVPIFLDSKRKDLYKFPRFKIKINDAEATAQERRLPDGSVVTLGADGAYYTGSKPIVYYHAPKVQAVDVCGAGDAFLAGYVYGHVKQTTIDPIIYGICNGSISVKHLGCYAPSYNELTQEVYHYIESMK